MKNKYKYPVSRCKKCEILFVPKHGESICKSCDRDIRRPPKYVFSQKMLMYGVIGFIGIYIFFKSLLLALVFLPLPIIIDEIIKYNRRKKDTKQAVGEIR